MHAPTLRFEEFTDGWLSKNLGEISRIASGGTPSRSNKSFWGGDIPWVTTAEIKFGLIKNSQEKITAVGLKNSSAKIFPKGTLLMAMYGQGKTRGQVAKLGIDASTNQACAAILLEKDVSQDYVLQYLGNQYENIRSLSNDGGQKNLSSALVKEIPIWLPSIEEQTKIANFLTAIDAKISQLIKKHQLLSSYKTGVMQKIFSQELRFKDESGEYFPAWKIVRLSEIAEFFRGGQLAKSHLNINGENLCIHYGELFTVYAETISTVKSRTNISDGFIGYAGDIVMPSSDVTPDGLARASCLLIDRVILGGDMNIIRPIKTVDPAMLSYLLNFDKKKVIDLVSGTTVKHIYIKDIKGIELATPRSLNEQSAISTFLIELDKKIQIVKLQIELSKKYKQGLLQQMFV